MAEIVPVLPVLPVQPEQMDLEAMTDDELYHSILQAGSDWTARELRMVKTAYRIGCAVHVDDTHRNQPYTYHLLRNTARIVHYLHITDPEIIAGEILHDSVEDHPEDILDVVVDDAAGSPVEHIIPPRTADVRAEAVLFIRRVISPRVGDMVEGLTNPPSDPSERLDPEQKLIRYIGHAAIAIRNPDVFIGKLADWADNGLGIVHGDIAEGTTRRLHFERKYGTLIPVLEDRYRQPDIQAMLSPAAKANVEQMFRVGRQRLRVS